MTAVLGTRPCDCEYLRARNVVDDSVQNKSTKREICICMSRRNDDEERGNEI